MDFIPSLYTWFDISRRELPWRTNRTWYRVWISEIMLQQTRVDQVIPYFLRFVERFPDIQSLANAPLQDVLKLWEGLGYYSRARNLHRSAGRILHVFDGDLPDNPVTVRSLPGFGPYITNAVLSLAYNIPLAVVDGNILRVITRLYGIEDDIRDNETRKQVQQIMDDLIPIDSPGKFNEAMMEFGALVCLPSKPDCVHCPLQNNCRAFKDNTVFRLPYKSAPPRRPVVKQTALILFKDRKVLIGRRPASGLLGGMWEFPMVDGHAGNGIQLPAELLRIPALSGFELARHIRHTYSHFHLELLPMFFQTDIRLPDFDFYESLEWINIGEFDRYPMHRAMLKLIEACQSGLEIMSEGKVK